MIFIRELVRVKLICNILRNKCEGNGDRITIFLKSLDDLRRGEM